MLSEVVFCPDKLKDELPLYVLKRLNLTFAKYTQSKKFKSFFFSNFKIALF